MALNIRASSYFSRTRMFMIGPNVLDLPYFDDPRVCVGGKYPVLAVLDYQMDYLAIRYMLGQMKLIAGRLESLMFSENNGKHWYEIYLTTFVLLSSLEIVHARQIEILRRFQEKVSVYPHMQPVAHFHETNLERL